LLLRSGSMHDRSPEEVLRLMLLDMLHEAEMLRPHDAVRAAQLDDAANDLRIVIAEGRRESKGHPSAA
jgi:hypothetical protein